MSHTAITRFVERYENDEVAQLLLVLEQLETCSEMLEERSVAKSRSCLILLDNLADILLQRHAESCFRRGDVGGPSDDRIFNRNEQREVRHKFEAKLDLASGGRKLGRDVAPVIDLDQRAALWLAHAHRNGAYHRDQHNPGVVRLIAALQFDAVCRLWPAVTPGLGVGGLDENSRLTALEPYGVTPEDRHGMRNAIWLPEAAEEVSQQLTERLELSLPAVQANLAWDLLDRVDVASGVMRELLDGGMEIEQLLFSMRHSEFWAEHGSDAEMVELAQRADHWTRRDEADENHRFPPEVDADMAQANHLRNLRYIQLSRSFEPNARIETIREVTEAGPKLLGMDSLAETLERYLELDSEVGHLERVLPHVIHAWDRGVEDAVDRALGK